MNSIQKLPPRILSCLLERLISIEIRSGAMEDFAEQYNWICQNRNRFIADIWYIAQILQLLPGVFFKFVYWEISMFINNLKLNLRNIKKHKIFTAINILGLSIGMTCSILLFLWIKDELSFDKFHEHGKNIYRVIEKTQYDSGISYSAVTPAPVAPLIKSQTPEILEFARMWPENLTVEYANKSFSLRTGIVDPSFLKMFSFPLTKGDLDTALALPPSILLTEGESEKIFGKDDPIGKTLQIFGNKDITVTGILADVPRNSHLQFGCLVPLSLAEELGVSMENWADSKYFTYIRLHGNADALRVSEKIKNIEKNHAPGGSNSELLLQPFTKIYLYGLNRTGPILYVYIFALVALVSLVLACINFINLTTARSSQRAKEIGIKKAVGAGRLQIIRQLLGETTFLTFFSLMVAVLLVMLVLPAFNQLAGKKIELDILSYPAEGLGLILITLLTGLLAGAYPAFYISSFKPVRILRGQPQVSTQRGTPILRKTLVIFQFIVSIALITCTIIIYSQMNFIRHKDLGIDISNIFYVPVEDLENDYEALKTELRKNPNIINVTATSFPLVSYAYGTSAAEWEGKQEGQRISMGLAMVDFDTFETFQVKVSKGRRFQKEFATDATEAYIVNETAAKAMGMQDPIGNKFSWNQRNGKIIGVVKDFHNISLRQPIQPLVFMILPSWFRCLCIKINPSAAGETLSFLKEKWDQFRPGLEFSPIFLDSFIDGLYRSEQRMGKVLQTFALLAIFVSCLGLFGLTTYSTAQRTKEIGIRKVLGASVSRVTILLSREFILWVLIANIAAWPVAYFFMNKWLQNFAYRISLGVGVFIISSLLALFIAFLTVSVQSIRTALSHPVDSLRYE